MEFSASFPVDLTRLTEGFTADGTALPGGRAPAGHEFAGVLARQSGSPEPAGDGEILPPGGESLPVVAVLPLPIVVPLPVVEPSLEPARVETGSPGGGHRAPPLPVPLGASRVVAVTDGLPLSPLRAAVAAVLDAPEQTVVMPVAPGAAAPTDADGAPLTGAPPAAVTQPIVGAAAHVLPLDDAAAVPMPSPSASAEAASIGGTAPRVDARQPSIDAVAVDSGRDVAADSQDGERAPPRLPGVEHAEATAPMASTQSTPTADADAEVALPLGGPAAPRAASTAAVPAERAAEPGDLPRQFDLEPGADIDQLAARVRWLADRQIGEARIRLNPPELGALDIRLSVVDDETFVHISAQGAGTRELLEGSIPRLRALLGAGGLALGGASVDSGQRGGAEQGFRFDEPRGPASVEPLARDESRPAAGLRASSTRVDLYA